jgi:predicted glycogen debranching enzyme
MISLPGLALATGRAATARAILTTFASFVDQGMLPNVFPGAGEHADYNTADAALWFFEAWRAYLAATGDEEAVRRVFPVLVDMIDWHVKGTRYGIGVDPQDGLLRAGEAGVQVTWMDAKIGDWVVTPRIGKPVEINALWYNALRIMAAFARRFGADDPFTARAEQARGSFEKFVRPDRNGLFDVLDGPSGNDASVRPNQIIAVSLHNRALDEAAQRAAVSACARALLTSYGLRSLAPASPGYIGHYRGGPVERDSAYHQGPVWGWLLGHYALASYRITGDAIGAQALLQPMAEALRDGAIGTIGEIFDGDAPHRPKGAPSQAWSVACTLDAWVQLERLKHPGQSAPAGAAPQSN